MMLERNQITYLTQIHPLSLKMYQTRKLAMILKEIQFQTP